LEGQSLKAREKRWSHPWTLDLCAEVLVAVCGCFSESNSAASATRRNVPPWSSLT